MTVNSPYNLYNPPPNNGVDIFDQCNVGDLLVVDVDSVSKTYRKMSNTTARQVWNGDRGCHGATEVSKSQIENLSAARRYQPGQNPVIICPRCNGTGNGRPRLNGRTLTTFDCRDCSGKGRVEVSYNTIPQ